MLQGIGIDETLEEIVRKVPAPENTADKPLRALIFDSHYDSYKVPVQFSGWFTHVSISLPKESCIVCMAMWTKTLSLDRIVQSELCLLLL